MTRGHQQGIADARTNPERLPVLEPRKVRCVEALAVAADVQVSLGEHQTHRSRVLRGELEGIVDLVPRRRRFAGESQVRALPAKAAQIPSHDRVLDEHAVRIEHASVVTVPNTGHSVVGEAPEALAEMVADFLDTEHLFG